MTDGPRLYHLALRDLHAAAGARFRPAEGWSLPEDYGSPEQEYRALRAHAVVVDKSHRSRFMVTGTDAADVLGAVFAGRVIELEEGRAMRSVSLDERGNIRDLALIARTGGIAYLVNGESAPRLETRALLELAASAPEFDARVDDRTESTCLVSLVGPAAEGVARQHLSEGLSARLRTMHSAAFEFHGFRTLTTRTSEVGEDGFEFVLAPAVAQHIVETLRAAGVPVAGRSATEVARIEAGVPAFNPDLTPGLSPAEADLDVLLNIAGGRCERVLCATLFDIATPPAPGSPVMAGERKAGEVRSACRSWAMNATIGLTLLDARFALPGTALTLDGFPVHVSAKPIYRRRTT
jgi:aminomethyltransferase